MDYLGLARRMGILLRPFVFGIVLLSASSSLAIDRQQVEMSARESFAAGRYGEALALFAKLYAETLHPVYLRNIGRCHQKMRDPDQAIDSFRDYLTKAKKLPADERAGDRRLHQRDGGASGGAGARQGTERDASGSDCSGGVGSAGCRRAGRAPASVAAVRADGLAGWLLDS